MIYITKDYKIIADGVETTVKGVKYVIDISDMDNVKAYRLSEIATLGDTFDFVVKYYPGYSQSEEVASFDDLCCIIEGECDDEKTERVTMDWGSDPDIWIIERDRIYSELIEGAIENYIKEKKI